LTPEVADTYTYGFILEPQFVPGLIVSVDYYRIVIKNTIESLTSNTVVNNCGLTGDPTLCGLIHRGTGTGSLWFNQSNYINTNEVNIGTVSTKGIDLSSHYRLDIGPAGKVGFTLAGTRSLDYLTQPLTTGGAYDCVGYFGTTCGAPTPKWRHVLNTVWSAPWAGLDVNFRWRYIGPTLSDRVSQDPQLAQAYYAGTARIGGYSYFDLSASMPVSGGVSVRFGVNNIADKAPPIVANGNYSDCPNTSCNDNTWVGTYDTLGRYLYARVSAKF
jgi:outer membrane receptor protein involved in Fe transport